jgi:hypothetical protein
VKTIAREEADVKLRSVKTAAAMVVMGMLSFAVGSLAQPRYPNIDAAEGSLQSALVSLRNTRDIFGGHKGSAERLINRAIGELEIGKQFAAAHGY